jgi:hypothetical protein
VLQREPSNGVRANQELTKTQLSFRWVPSPAKPSSAGTVKRLLIRDFSDIGVSAVFFMALFVWHSWIANWRERDPRKNRYFQRAPTGTDEEAEMTGKSLMVKKTGEEEITHNICIKIMLGAII